MKRKVRAGGQRPIVGVNLADPKNARGSAPVALGLAQTCFVLSGESAAPGEPILAKENREGRANSPPWTGPGALEALQSPAHRVPAGGTRNNKLRTTFRTPAARPV